CRRRWHSLHFQSIGCDSAGHPVLDLTRLEFIANVGRDRSINPQGASGDTRTMGGRAGGVLRLRHDPGPPDGRQRGEGHERPVERHRCAPRGRGDDPGQRLAPMACQCSAAQGQRSDPDRAERAQQQHGAHRYGHLRRGAAAGPDQFGSCAIRRRLIGTRRSPRRARGPGLERLGGDPQGPRAGDRRRLRPLRSDQLRAGQGRRRGRGAVPGQLEARGREDEPDRLERAEEDQEEHQPGVRDLLRGQAMSIREIRAAAAALAILGCAGPSHQHKASLNNLLASRDWAAATRQLQEAKDTEYASRDAVLYWLDVAAVLHDAGNFKESDKALDEAEQRLEALYTQSISKGAGTFFLNDTTDDYRGEPHERSLLHILRALNYAYAGRTEEAVVESRKVSAFLAELGSTLGSNYTYRDDAFAQYLSALLFEDAGRRDDARISYRAAHAAYSAYASRYGTPEPPYDLGTMGRDEGEVVFLHYAGVAPRRTAESVQVAWNDALIAVQTTGSDDENAQVKNAITAGLSANAITVAFPQYVQDPFVIVGSEVEVAGRRAQTMLVQDRRRRHFRSAHCRSQTRAADLRPRPDRDVTERRLLPLLFALLIAAGKPDWVDRESVEWPREMYLLGVGSADERAVAEDRAR